jgi:hypothetical protein
MAKKAIPKYVIVHFMAETATDTTFRRDKWPLHLTLAPPFEKLARFDALKSGLSDFCNFQHSFDVVLGEVADLGSRQFAMARLVAPCLMLNARQLTRRSR